jgi:DNA-binding MarR family transcriptional regulator
MARRPTGKRSRLLDELMLQARRSGSLGTMHNRAAADLAGVNETDWECLDVLDWTGPITAGELARHVGITSGAVTGAIDRLEKLGLVRRRTDPSDRRKVIVALDLGNQSEWSARNHKLTACFGALADEVAALNEEFDEEHLAAVTQWLRLSNEALVHSIERMREAAASP